MATTATYALQVSWNNDGTFGGTYDDITADITPGATVSYSFGREQPFTLPGLGESSAGSLEVELFNIAGKYSSLNASSVIYGSIKPGRPVRLQATYSAVTYTLWSGYLQAITPAAPEVGVLPKAQLTAFGPLSRLTGKDVTPPAYNSGALTGTIASAILDEAGIVNYSVDVGNTTTSRWYCIPGTSAFEALQQIEQTECGWIRERKDNFIIVDGRQHRLTNTECTVSNATFSDAAAATLGYLHINQDDATDALVNEVSVLVPTFTVASVAPLWTLAETNVEIGPGQTRAFIAEYPNEGNSQGAYVDTWQTPIAGTDIVASNIDAATYIEVATIFASSTAFRFKGPNTMRVSIRNTHPSTTAVLTLVQAQGTAVAFGDPIRILSEDATSKTAYGRRSYDFPGPWLPNTTVAQSYADYLIAQFKTPIPALTLGYRANQSSGHMVQALSRELSDRITVKADGVTMLGFNQDWFIERQEHTIAVSGFVHDVVYQLSPASSAIFWILGTSALDTGTILAF